MLLFSLVKEIFFLYAESMSFPPSSKSLFFCLLLTAMLCVGGTCIRHSTCTFESTKNGCVTKGGKLFLSKIPSFFLVKIIGAKSQAGILNTFSPLPLLGFV